MKAWILFIAVLLPGMMFSQQRPDLNYHPRIADPAYAPGKGPVVFIDEGHFDLNTKNGRYKPFADVLERDGYVVKGYKGKFTEEGLSKGKILVVSNALNKKNVGHWYLPTPSAFTNEEIEAVKKWVSNGGSLFLIADHMPMPGAAKALAAAFGFEMTNGFAINPNHQGPAVFSLKDGTLTKSILTTGRNKKESVRRIATFTGQAFRIPKEATPILTFNGNYVDYLPDTAWRFNSKTRRYSAQGMSQGAFRKFGKGKIVVFGEAAMFNAQLIGLRKIKAGMNSPIADQNYKLLLNIIHWLDGKLK